MMKVALFSLIACLMLQLTGFAATEQDTKDIDEVKQEAPVKAPRMESTPLVPKEEKTMTTTADEGPDATKEEIARSHAQMMEKMKEMQAKFDALTDEQKKEIYDLYDKINVSKVELLDKYVSFGLITEQQAATVRQQLGQYAQNMRNEKQFLGLMEILPVKGGHAKRLEEKAKEQATTPTKQENTESSVQLNTNPNYDQMMKQLQQMQDKFNALTDEQKNQLYDIYDQIMINQGKLLEKYVEFELMTTEQATTINQQLLEHAKMMREGKQLIGFPAARTKCEKELSTQN